MAGAGVVWEKNTVDWLVAGAGAVWEENTIELEAGGAAEHSDYDGENVLSDALSTN